MMSTTTARDAKILRQYRKGISPAAIARKYGLQKNRVQQIINTMVVPAVKTANGDWSIKCRICKKPVIISNRQRLNGRSTCNDKACIYDLKYKRNSLQYSKIKKVELVCHGCHKKFYRLANRVTIARAQWWRQNKLLRPAKRRPFFSYCGQRCYQRHRLTVETTYTKF